jgi:magnesium transporter
VLVFDVMSGGDSHAQSIFMWDLEGKLSQGSKAMGGLPYELRYGSQFNISPLSDITSFHRIPLIVTFLGGLLTLARWRVF